MRRSLLLNMCICVCIYSHKGVDRRTYTSLISIMCEEIVIKDWSVGIFARPRMEIRILLPLKHMIFSICFERKWIANPVTNLKKKRNTYNFVRSLE